MKKLASLAFLFALLLALCACGQVEPVLSTAPPATSTTASPTTQPPATHPIECPVSYIDAPEAYKPILDALYIFVHAVRQGNRELATKAFDAIGIPDESVLYMNETDDLGYAITDINRDGIPELVILKENSPNVLSLHTLKGDTPVYLLNDWGRYSYGQFAADGTLYCQDISSGGCFFYSYRLEPSADRLTDADNNLFMFMHDEYYRGFSNSKGAGERGLTEKEYQAIYKEFNSPANPMPLTYIPIEQ